MKKYISLLIVLLMVFGISFKVQAEDQIELNDVNQIKPIMVDENGNPIPTLFRGENRSPKIEKEQEKLKTDLRLKREEGNKEIKDAQETLKKEMEQNREAAKQEMEKKREENKQEREKTREDGKTKLEALKESIKNEKDVTKAKIEENRITGRIKAFERFTQMESNIAELKDRINTSILKIEAKGVDTTKAKALVVTADTALVGMQTKIIEANILLSASTNQLSIETKASLLKITQDLQTLINTAHKALNNATKSLQGEVKAKIEADKATTITPTTTTPESTN